MAEYKGVVICGEVVEGRLAAIATELLGCGRKLADELKEELSAVLIGSGVKESAPELIAYGADRVYVVDDPLLKDYQNDSYVAAMEKVVSQATAIPLEKERRKTKKQSAYQQRPLQRGICSTTSPRSVGTEKKQAVGDQLSS